MKSAPKKKNFTLIELLIVIAVLAIIGGSMIAAYDGVEDKAAHGAATRDVAALDQSIRNYKATKRALPDHLESLCSATPGTAIAMDADAAIERRAGATGAALATFLNPELPETITVGVLTKDEVKALSAAGLNNIRFLSQAADVAGLSTAAPGVKAADGTTALNVGDILKIDLPTHAFEAPIPGAGHNRGRGFALDVESIDVTTGLGTDPSTLSLPIWEAGTGGYENVKVGAKATARLVALGVGPGSSLVRGDAVLKLAGAPRFGGSAPNEYQNYIALIDVSQSPARLVTVIDSHGHIGAETNSDYLEQSKE